MRRAPLARCHFPTLAATHGARVVTRGGAWRSVFARERHRVNRSNRPRFHNVDVCSGGGCNGNGNSVGTSNASVRARVMPTRCPRREEAGRELTTTGRCRSSCGFEAGRMSLLQCLLALGELHFYFRVDVALSLLAEVLGGRGVYLLRRRVVFA